MSDVTGSDADSPVRALAELLQAAGAEPILNPHRIAPSVTYDLRYRLMVDSCVFAAHAKRFNLGPPRIHAAKFKLIQFVAIRPWLMTTIRAWCDADARSSQLSVGISQRLRRGFLSDSTHDSVVAFMVARGILQRDGAHLSAGREVHLLAEWNLAVIRANCFAREREVIEEFRDLRISNDMLEGW